MISRCKAILVGTALLWPIVCCADPSSGGAFVLNPDTIDGGGGGSTGGVFSLTTTIGQPDASNTMSGGAFALTGGFWRQARSGGGSAGLIFQDSFE